MATTGVVVITGAGGMGTSIARRLGAGSALLLADRNSELLAAAASGLRASGHDVVEQALDVSDAVSVARLAERAASLGPVHTVVHTAGVSPVQAPVSAILSVDLLGTALVLEAFGGVIAPGGAGVFISSMAGHLFPLEPALERRLARVPAQELLALPELAESALTDAATAYGIAKRGNQLRVRSASASWRRRDARVNSVSPGIISTPMGADELAGPNGVVIRELVANSGAGRFGTPEDIAEAVAFLVGPGSTYISGTDLLVDGGVVATALS